MSNKKRHTKRHLSERTRAALRRAGKKGAEAAHAAQRAKYTPEELHAIAQRRGQKGGAASQAGIPAKYTPDQLHRDARRRAGGGGAPGGAGAKVWGGGGGGDGREVRQGGSGGFGGKVHAERFARDRREGGREGGGPRFRRHSPQPRLHPPGRLPRGELGGGDGSHSLARAARPLWSEAVCALCAPDAKKEEARGMIGTAAVRARGVTLLDVHNVGAGGLVFRFHAVIARIAKRFGADFARSWTRALIEFKHTIDEARLLSAIASGNRAQVEAVVYPHALQLQLQRALRDPLLRAMQAAGQASVQFLSAHGIRATFNAVHPNVVLYAQTRSAELVTSITEDVRETLRLITAYGASGRATVVEQARMIREVIGLPRNWALAPLRFGDELRAAARTGEIGTLGRRLSGADMVKVRAAIEGGTADSAFIQEMEATYAERLINL